jgi:hypothetical protein
MAKPTITTRASKGSALTWTEGDANLTNLQNATISVTDGTNTAVLDLNDTLTLTAGTNITLSVNATTDTVTINSTASGGATTLDGLSDVVITAAATNDALIFDGTNWVDTALSGVTVGAASTVTQTNDNTNATRYPLFTSTAVDASNISPKYDTGFTYNPSTGVLTTTTFSGALSGNATTASSATNINISTNTGNSSDTTLYPVLVAANTTGNQAPHIDSNAFYYDASTDTLTIGTASQTTGKIKLFSDGLYGITLQAPSGVASNINFTLPTTAGSAGNFLVNSGSGVTSWTSAPTTPFTFNNTTANSPKLTIGTSSLSSTAWTTNGIGLRVSAATYTDTNSTAGTVAASHVHAIAAPTMASTNAITVTDAGTLYISGAPTAGTNTTITNGWALLANGPVKSTGLTVTASGELRLADSDSSNYVGFKSPATVTTNKIWTLPAADGTSGQVLSTDGAGVLSWATAGGGGGNNIVVLSMGSQLLVPATADGALSPSWTLQSSGGISGVSAATNTVTLPAGTYMFELPDAYTSDSGGVYSTVVLKNGSTVLATIDNLANNPYRVSGTDRAGWRRGRFIFTLASSGTLQLYKSGSYPSYQHYWNEQHGRSLIFMFYKLA